MGVPVTREIYPYINIYICINKRGIETETHHLEVREHHLPDLIAVAECAPSLVRGICRRSPAFGASHKSNNTRRNRLRLMKDPHRNPKGWVAMGEVCRTIERIDTPQVFGRRVAIHPSFFPQHRVVRALTTKHR